MTCVSAIDEDDPLERARRAIEADPSEAVTLEDLAAIAGLSAYHFTRQFAARFGVPPMTFVRSRRMALAARQLSGEQPPALIELAFDSGFETQEGFTRAFKRTFGVSPGRFRQTPDKEMLQMTIADQALMLTMEPAPQRRPAFRAVGASAVFTEENKSKIPALWPLLVAKLPLAGQAGWEIYGVMWADDASPGQFHYMAAVAIEADAPAPEGLEIKDVPAQHYLVFRQTVDGSDLHTQMQAAGREIWGERLPKSGYQLAHSPDLEVYPPDFTPGKPGWVEWWIPVKV